MESVRAVVFLSVCLTLLTSLCQGQRSADSSTPDEPIVELQGGSLCGEESERHPPGENMTDSCQSNGFMLTISS
ncbi:hypothetical protein F2P81_022891 [Scophthalmus maximus]|uniref:Uncharacterized protein n=1 Tax=Scophthalmus maximus TaxID=52904 RepID=A0A6A4RUY2_SCOMX|nr:hypothetical protein F2P81_022891 [Scophthalmus maximus]